jgi:hypothetical protein
MLPRRMLGLAFSTRCQVLREVSQEKREIRKREKTKDEAIVAETLVLHLHTRG